MNHLTVLTNSPVLWLGAVSFRANRLDIYEQLLAKLDPTGRTTVQSISEIFAEWAAREKKRGDALRYLYDFVRKKTEKGTTLSGALRPFLDNDEFLILAAGEVEGNLRESLKRVLRNSEARQETVHATLVAMWMPATSFLTVLAMSIMLGIYLWPDFVRAVPAKYWPAWTRPGIAVQIWLGAHWPVAFVFVMLWGAYVATLTPWTGRTREWVDRFPPWSIHKARLGANVLTTLAALVAAGRTVREGFVMIRDHASPYLRWHMDRLIRRYDSPNVEGAAVLRTGLFSQRMMDRVEDAAVGRSFDETLRDVGDRSLKLVVRTVRAQATAASLGLLLIVGLLMVYMAVLIVFGIQDATDAFTRALQGSSLPQ